MLQNESKSLWIHEPSAKNCINFISYEKWMHFVRLYLSKQDYIIPHQVKKNKSLLFILFTESNSSFGGFTFVSMINIMC